MRTIITLLITVLSINSFGQKNTNVSVNAKNILKKYYPKNETLHKKVNDFYDSLASCRDTSTVDWLFREQGEVSALLASNFELNKIWSEGLTIEQILKDLNKSLLGFEFDQTYSGDFHLLVYPDIKFVLDHARENLMRGEPNETSMKIEKAFEIFFYAWGPYTAYCYDVCCDCAPESALGSGLHIKLLSSIAIFTAYSDLFSEAFEEIKEGIKSDVLHTHAFSSPKKAILAEFAIIKPLLGLSAEEELIYEKKRIYLEETSEEDLHNYGR